MGWSKKYKKSIDCNNPKGFSQKAHCAGRKKQESKMSLKLEELVGKRLTEEQFDEAAGKKDACYHKVKARYDVWPSAYASGALVKCRKVGAKNWGNKSKKEGVNEAPQKYRVYVKQKAHVGGPASKKFSVEKFQTGGMYFDYKKGMDTIKKLRKMNSSADYKLVKEGVNEAQRTSVSKSELSKAIKQIRGKEKKQIHKPIGATLIMRLANELNVMASIIYKLMIKYKVGTEYIKGVRFEGVDEKVLGGKGIKEGYSMRDLGLSPFFKKLSKNKRIGCLLLLSSTRDGAP